mgnify:CR=1 FL=1
MESVLKCSGGNDITSHTGGAPLPQICRRIAHELVARYEWRLLPADELVKQMLDAVVPETSEGELERVAKHRYTLTLYEACLQEEDLPRRERAYRELHRYLYRAAYNRWPELAEDTTQQAIILVYEQIERCRAPGTFLAFALWKLRHAFQIVQRARGKEFNCTDIDDIDRRHSIHQQPSAHSHLFREERLCVLIEAIRHIPDKRKQKAIVLKYVAELSDEEIGDQLNVTANYVRLLRYRGLERLREDEQLRDYFNIERNEAV